MINILVAYGSLTGNTQMVAERIADYYKTQGHQVTLQNIGELSSGDLHKYSVLLLGSSTWDDGQLQIDAQSFVDMLNLSEVNLSKQQFAVFGCGDSSYPSFCYATETLTSVLKKTGAQQLHAELKIDGFPEISENITLIEQWCTTISTHLTNK